MRVLARHVLASSALLLGVGCGGAQTPVSEPSPVAGKAVAPQPPPVAERPSSTPDAGATAAARPAADAGAAVATPPVAERPYAKTPAEARAFIEEQVHLHMQVLWQCIVEHNATGSEHHRFVIDIGIDQDGHLISVAATGKKANALAPAAHECIVSILREGLFPRSHSAITTVRETFTDIASGGTP